MSTSLLRADARCLPLADDTVDLVVTSPPYFGLRSYTDGGEHYSGQIGSEPTPTEFVDALLDVTRECARVLKPTGSLWVNLGDSYAANERGPDGGSSSLSNGAQVRVGRGRSVKQAGVRRKSLIGLPWRYALRCIDDLGLILRAEVIWSKPNGLPESVTDRVRRSHEQWFHFTLSPRYFSAVDEVREEHLTVVGGARRNSGGAFSPDGKIGSADGSGHTDGNPLGKLPGSVWTIPTQPLTVPASLGVDHFAAFPMELPRRIIRGWSPSGICVDCGEGRRPVVSREYVKVWNHTPGKRMTGNRDNNLETFSRDGRGYNVGGVTGYECACGDASAPTRPAVVLDPFGGTGTTALVASTLGRHGISVDRSADYCRLAAWRTTDPGQRAAAMQVEKPRTQIDGQEDLFGGVA